MNDKKEGRRVAALPAGRQGSLGRVWILIIECCLLIIVYNPVHAATTDLAQKVETRYKNITSWQADFDQVTFVEILKDKINKKGNITVKRPNKIRIEYKTAPYKTYATDGKKLWIYKKNSLTAKEFKKPKKIISQEALSFLGGLKNLSELFDVMTGLGESNKYLKIKNSRLKKLHLIPKNQESSVLKITLGIDQKESTIREAVLFNRAGNVTHYQFSHLSFDDKIDDGVFTLPKEPKRKVLKQ